MANLAMVAAWRPLNAAVGLPMTETTMIAARF